MFEKEAKEYCNALIQNEIKVKSIYDIEVMQKDLEKFFQDAAIFGYNKANEWHYVKDGDLPKENQLVLLYRENPNGANVALAYWCKSYVNDKVIAWKEIVLPELKESE